MRIKTQFTITMVLFIIILMLVIATAIIVNLRTEKVNQQEMTARNIVQEASELSYLGNDYLIHRESQQLARWQSKFTSFSNHMTKLKVDKPEQQVLVHNIRANQQRLKEIFENVASTVGTSSGNQKLTFNVSLLQVSWSRMTVQSQGLVSDALRLSHLLHTELGHLNARRTIFIYLILGLLGVFLLSAYIQTFQRTLKSLAKLQAGVGIIGSGNLDFKIEEKRNDEIGDLSHAFNQMTIDLKGMTASRAELEREITEREQAEVTLKKSKERFEILSETTSRLLATDRPEEIVNELFQKVMEYLDCHAFFNYLVDEEEGRLHLNAYAGISEETSREIEWLDYGVAVCGCAARDASRIICEDIPTTFDPRTDIVKSFGIQAFACHPLLSAGQVIGTLSFGTRSRTTFHNEELSLMKTVADQVAIAMERVRLIKALRMTRDELEKRVNERTIELAKANELLEKMFFSIDIMVAYMDKDFNFIRVNRAYAEADEREPEFYVGKNHFGLFPNEENEQIFRKVVETGEPYSVFAKPFEYAEHPERGVTHWDWSLQPVREPDGKVGGVVLSLINVTERIRAQETIVAERQRFNDVLEVLPVYVVLLAPDYSVPFANRVFRERFGESHGKRCFEHLFGRCEPCETCETYTVLKTMSPHEWEWTGPDSRIYQVFDFPFTDTDGSTLILEMGIDITKHKQAEEALKGSETLLRTVFESLPVGVWLANKEGHMIHGNPAGQKIWAGAQSMGIDQFREHKGWWVETGKIIEPEEWAVVDALRKGESSLNQEIEIECFDGTHKIILNSAVPIRNEKQEITGAFVVNEDITERKRAEKNLRQIQKMEALGTLAGGIAHDFNNILMPITINTEMVLLDAAEGSSLHHYLQPVLDAAKRGRDLVNQIITYSRQREQERAPVKITPIIKEAINFLRSSLAKNIEIRVNIETESDIIQADPTQIHQVLMNLSSNAIYAMREKGGILDVRLTSIEIDSALAAKYPDLRPGPYVRLTINDTGCGMSPDVMERIFDPFFTTKRPGEGTGMGLPVVQGIVKSHGGAIAVYSEIEKGSAFNIFIPRVQDKANHETTLSKSIPTGRERILLVDDEKVQLQSVQNMLERFKYHVVAKADSVEALDLFQASPEAFDLIITDQTMPKMTGEKLAESILRIRPDIPIILCTGFSEVIDVDKAKTMGIREFVMKPFTIQEITETIRQVLSVSSSPLKIKGSKRGKGK